MKKYFILLICLIINISIIMNNNTDVVREYNDSVYVFYEIDTNIISNPDTSDIKLSFYLVLFFYNIALLIMFFYDLRRISKYEKVMMD